MEETSRQRDLLLSGQPSSRVESQDIVCADSAKLDQPNN